jgi:hypothetical protein
MKAKSNSDAALSRSAWEQARLMSFYTVIAMGGTKEIEKPADLFPLPWDEGEEPKPVGKRLTKEEFLINATKILGK